MKTLDLMKVTTIAVVMFVLVENIFEDYKDFLRPCWEIVGWEEVESLKYHLHILLLHISSYQGNRTHTHTHYTSPHMYASTVFSFLFSKVYHLLPFPK